MRGKIAFVLGLAVGYVLGTRAGRERYEQIKRASQKLWDSPGVKRGRDQVGGYVSDVSSNLQDSVIDAGKSFLQSVMQFAQARNQEPAPASATAATQTATPTADATTPAASKKPAAKKPVARKPAAKKPAAKKPSA